MNLSHNAVTISVPMNEFKVSMTKRKLKKLKNHEQLSESSKVQDLSLIHI